VSQPTLHLKGTNSVPEENPVTYGLAENLNDPEVVNKAPPALTEPLESIDVRGSHAVNFVPSQMNPIRKLTALSLRHISI
jgi:hypothetical protein